VASSGFCTTCTKVVYYTETDEAHCPVCSGPLIATENGDAVEDQAS